MHPIPHECPVCPGELSVNRFDCSHCDPIIEGHFLGPLSGLNGKQLNFAETFHGARSRTSMKTKKRRMRRPD